MALCDYQQQSFFKWIFDPKRDFAGWDQPYEIPESMQMQYDPVGFFFFKRTFVYRILAELKRVNKRRMDLRDLLREMDRIWRQNNQQHQVLNEADWISPDEVAARVSNLVMITRKKLQLEERVENMVTGDIIKQWENQMPVQHPLATTEKISSSFPMRVPYIDSSFTQQPFKSMSSFNKKVYIT